MRLFAPFLLLVVLLFGGCVSYGPSTDLSPVNLETARYETDAAPPAIVAAAQTLVPQYASRVGLVDVGGGRVETEYVTLRAIQETQESTEVPGGPILATTLIRYTVQAMPTRRGRTAVTVTATMRPTGAAYLPQRTPARYWLDRFTADLATATGSSYRPVISDEAYLASIDRGGDVRAPSAPGSGSLSKPLRTIGLVGLGLIAASIIVTAAN
ncbi:MAG TPA: hypothetical protein VD948_12055 [Rhodothermales bacterium]|nr:hypothetical protein [Rhodothermales bacterium]